MARELGLGGTERQLAEIALALDRERFEPHVGCFTGGGFRARELREAGVPILELGVRSLVSPSAVAGARRMGAYLARHEIGLVHAFDVPLDLFAVPVARWYRTPVVLSSHARASRSDAGGDAASAAGDGPDGGWNCGQFAGGGAGTGGAGRGAGFHGAAGLQRAGYQRVPPRRGTGGTAVGRGGGGDRDGLRAAAGEGAGHPDGGFSEGESDAARGEAGDCGERADAGGVSRRAATPIATSSRRSGMSRRGCGRWTFSCCLRYRKRCPIR